jgi:hypothetical protein
MKSEKWKMAFDSNISLSNDVRPSRLHSHFRCSFCQFPTKAKDYHSLHSWGNC